MSEGRPEVTQEPISFSQAVMAAIKIRNVKAVCAGCSMFGWAGFHLHPVPVLTPTVISEQALISACFICTKCGLEKRFNLNALGLTLTMQENRVITPEQIRQQAPPIVIPG